MEKTNKKDKENQVITNEENISNRTTVMKIYLMVKQYEQVLEKSKSLSFMDMNDNCKHWELLG